MASVSGTRRIRVAVWTEGLRSDELCLRRPKAAGGVYSAGYTRTFRPGLLSGFDSYDLVAARLAAVYSLEDQGNPDPNNAPVSRAEDQDGYIPP